MTIDICAVYSLIVETINFKIVYPSMALKYKIKSTARGLNLVGRESVFASFTILLS